MRASQVVVDRDANRTPEHRASWREEARVVDGSLGSRVASSGVTGDDVHDPGKSSDPMRRVLTREEEAACANELDAERRAIERLIEQLPADVRGEIACPRTARARRREESRGLGGGGSIRRIEAVCGRLAALVASSRPRLEDSVRRSCRRAIASCSATSASS
jgi:hypothetical protein